MSQADAYDEEYDEEKVMTFREHLGELRTVLVRIALALVLGFFVGWGFRREIFEFLSSPITDALADNGIYHYQAISIAESIIVYLKAVFIADLAVMSPFVFYQLWSFVGPGLLDSEKRFVMPLTAFSVLFFLIGSAFAYQVILPFITDWLVKLTIEEGAIEMLVTMQNAYSTSFTFLLMFGLVFQLPLVIYFLALFGAATHTSLLRFWRYFVVISFIISAMLTPPDPISQVMMAVPLNGLYGFGIIVAWGVVRTRERIEREQDFDASVGAASMKIIAAGMFLLIVATALVVVFIRTLPGTPLAGFTPNDASWYVGLNPSALEGHSKELNALVSPLGIDDPGKLLSKAGVPIDEVAKAGVVGRDGQRLLLIRHEGVGERETAVHAAIDKALTETPPGGLTIGALDENTLAVGSSALFEAAAAIDVGEQEAAPVSESEDRLIRRLQTSGPIWAWLPRPKEGDALLSSGIAQEVVAVGAFLKAGKKHSIAIELRAADRLAGDALEARVESARLTSRGAKADQERIAIVETVKLLAAEAAREASDATRLRIEAAAQQLEAIGKRPRAAAPLFDALADHVEAWSVRREDQWVHVTAELGEQRLVDALNANSGTGTKPAPTTTANNAPSAP